jgi:hypothetical protein
MEAFGVHPDWQRQLSKFASVQDRLREWKPSVMEKLTTFSCMTITALDIDAIRVDKSTQVTVDGMTAWATATRACATNLGKKNFYITGEVTGGDTFGSLYMSVPISVSTHIYSCHLQGTWPHPDYGAPGFPPGCQLDRIRKPVFLAPAVVE